LLRVRGYEGQDVPDPFYLNSKGGLMSKEEKSNFISALLSEAVNVKGVNCKVRLGDMFAGGNNAVVVLRQKSGELIAIGI